MGQSDGGDDIPTIGVGMLGYGFMGKAHSNAYRTLAYMTWPPPLVPDLVAVAGRTEDAVAAAAARYGFAQGGPGVFPARRRGPRGLPAGAGRQGRQTARPSDRGARRRRPRGGGETLRE